MTSRTPTTCGLERCIWPAGKSELVNLCRYLIRHADPLHIYTRLMEQQHNKTIDMQGKRILEIGTATGGLAIFLVKHGRHSCKPCVRCRHECVLAVRLSFTQGYQVFTCDYKNAEIEDNIAHNFRLNDLAAPPHLQVLRLTCCFVSPIF